jgi:hypothetical protein
MPSTRFFYHVANREGNSLMNLTTSGKLVSHLYQHDVKPTLHPNTTKFNKRVDADSSRLATSSIQNPFRNAWFNVGNILSYSTTIKGLIYLHRPTPSRPHVRLTSTIVPPTEMTPSFEIDAKNKSYRHQYANIYFTRLLMLRNAVEKRAKARWDGLPSV